jgi:hypothetical protein
MGTAHMERSMIVVEASVFLIAVAVMATLAAKGSKA